MTPSPRHVLRWTQWSQWTQAAALAVGLTVVVAACASPPRHLVGQPPADNAHPEASPRSGPRRLGLADDAAHPRRTHPDPLFGTAGWPFMEENTTFELSWAAPAAAVAVHRQPDPNSPVVGRYEVTKGQRIPWRNTWVSVYKPALFRAKTHVEFDGQRYAPDDRDRHESPAHASVAPGERVAVYLYAGATTCYVGIDQLLMRTACPTPRRFSGDFSGRTHAQQMDPDQRIWWVFIQNTTLAGWIPVDDRMVVDIIEI